MWIRPRVKKEKEIKKEKKETERNVALKEPPFRERKLALFPPSLKLYENRLGVAEPRASYIRALFRIYGLS